MRIATYVRVSTDSQGAADAFGLPRQRESIAKYATENGHEIVREYEDVGCSGATAARPGLIAMLADAASGEFDAVLLHSWDRLARDAFLDGWLRIEFRERGVQILSATERNGVSEEAKLVQAVLSAVAGFERSLITSRLSTARRIKAEHGGYAHGQAPYGTRALRGTKALHWDEAEWANLVTMREMRDRGLTLRAISDAMNERGVKPRHASAWSHGAVRSALKGFERAAVVAV
ncbi:MAG: recombinase family protein [Vulcanimicrobiaceae bacterium]